jgi:hypothetical protein
MRRVRRLSMSPSASSGAVSKIRTIASRPATDSTKPYWAWPLNWNRQYLIAIYLTISAEVEAKSKRKYFFSKLSKIAEPFDYPM